MKVELNNIRLGFSELTGTVYAYIPYTDGYAKYQKDVTKDFEACEVMRTNFKKKQKKPVAKNKIVAVGASNVKLIEGEVDEKNS